MKREQKTSKKMGSVIAKILLYDCWRERVIYRVQIPQGDKIRGLMVIEKLKNLFGISNKDEEKHTKETIKWHRDPTGKIVSPFSKRPTKE